MGGDIARTLILALSPIGDAMRRPLKEARLPFKTTSGMQRWPAPLRSIAGPQLPSILVLGPLGRATTSSQGAAAQARRTACSAPSSSSSPSKPCPTHAEYDSILTRFAAASGACHVRLHLRPHEHENWPLLLQQTPPRSVAFGRASWPRTLPRPCAVAAPQPISRLTLGLVITPETAGVPQTRGRRNGRGRERGKVAPE